MRTQLERMGAQLAKLQYFREGVLADLLAMKVSQVLAAAPGLTVDNDTKATLYLSIQGKAGCTLCGCCFCVALLGLARIYSLCYGGYGV